MIRIEPYLKFQFKYGGRQPPSLDCWGLYRHIVQEHAGVDLPDFEGIDRPLAIARTLSSERYSHSWLEIPVGGERELDLVLLRGEVNEGRTTVALPQHVGCVSSPGWMIDILDVIGVRRVAFRSDRTFSVHPKVAGRVLGIFRPLALVDAA